MTLSTKIHTNEFHGLYVEQSIVPVHQNERYTVFTVRQTSDDRRVFRSIESEPAVRYCDDPMQVMT